MTVPPSGAAVELAYGGQRAVVVEVGGGLRSYAVDGRAVLDGYAEAEMCTAGRGQLLVPWPNRVAGGRYSHDGAPLRLALTEPAKGNAIHGLARWARWTLLPAGAQEVTARYLVPPQPGYPFAVDCAATYRLSAEGLAVRMSVTNVGSAPAPVGMGAHPYLAVGGGTADDCRLTVPAGEVLLTDDRGIPTGSAPVAATAHDFRESRPIGALALDTAYAELHRGDDRLVRVTLAPPDSPAVKLWADEAWPFVQVFTGDTVPQPERRRRGVAVEPMTCAPDAFNNGRGLRVLDPGETLAGAWGITPG